MRTGSVMLYDGEKRAFIGDRLRVALIARDFTPETIADKAGLEISSIYNALNGKPVRLATASKIFKALESRKPLAIVYTESEVA